MADSIDKNDSSINDFADDLDAMLNEVETSSDDELELIDDEDAIDRLLMDDVFDSEAKENFGLDGEESNDSADKNVINETSEINVDDILDDGFSVKTEGSLEVELENTPVSEALSESMDEVDEFSEDDFLMADFDISTDEDDEFSQGEVTENAEEQFNAEIEPVNDPDELIEEIEEVQEVEEEPDDENEKNIEISSAEENIINHKEIEQLTAQINQLWAGNEALKLEISELSIPDDLNDSFLEGIGQLQKEQSKLKKSVKENESKVPVVAYVALAIAIIALLVGGGVGYIGYGAQTSVSELEELIVSLEEEIEVLVANDTSIDIKKLKEKIKLLNNRNDKFQKQFVALNNTLKLNPLRPVVDDLVVQNEHAQKAIEQLLAKVEILENRPVVSRVVKKAKKVIVRQRWVVNLVSFKQDWYAKRKAAEFEKKGVPAEVIKATVNGEKWFRLRVKGFNSKYEAAAYAVRVKKILNLSSVWVTKR